MRTLVAVAAALVMLVGTVSVGRASVTSTFDTTRNYSDPIGDREGYAPDIGSIRVVASGSTVSFLIQIANLGPGLIEGDFVVVLVDTDRNHSTGCSGSEVALAVLGHTAPTPDTPALERCVNGHFQRAGSVTYDFVAGAGLDGPGVVGFLTASSNVGSSFAFQVGTDDDADEIDISPRFTFMTGSSGGSSGGGSTPARSQVKTLTLGHHPDVRAEATGANGANVRYAPVQSKGAASISYSKPSGSRFRLGKTAVNVTARGHGKVAHTSFTVTVADTTAPVFAPLASVTTTSTPGVTGATVTYGPVSAVDKVSGTVAATCIPQAGGVFASGPTTVSCSARDRAGNTGTASYPVVVPTVSNLAALQTATSYNWDYAPELVAATTVLTIPAANGANSAPLSYSWTASNGTIAANGTTATWTRELATGQPVPGVITVSASDGSSFTITF